jgi:dTDP-4-dehydrorhamnose reductase
MRILITGANGQLGQALQANPPSWAHITALSSRDLDITDPKRVQETVAASQPAWIVNAAAYTAVDKAEEEPEQAKAVNETAVRHLAEAADINGARLLHVSTDFVFDGTANRPYRPDDDTNPLNVYGRTKLAGEQAALDATQGDAVVVRTAWVYSRVGKNFLTTMQRLMRERDALNIVDDQRGTPTTASDLASALWAVVDKNANGGIYHFTNKGDASWYEFAVEIRRHLVEQQPEARLSALEPTDTAGFPTPAKRPAYSVLNCQRIFTIVDIPPHWKTALRRELDGRAEPDL